MAATTLVFAVVLYVSYEAAQARIPQHRATLERLVRAQTGLNLRFDSLNLQWGWTGPEVAFRRVELGEPGASTFLLRAAQLVMAFDAWRSIQTGTLELGRITLIGADIDLARKVGPPAAGRDDRPQGPHLAAVLRRWSGGKIEVDSGTLRIPDPAGMTEPVSLQIRHGTLARSGRKWWGQTDILLPHRLGRSLHLAMDLSGDVPGAADIAGSIRFDGKALQFAAWREFMFHDFAGWDLLPRTGVGTFRGQLVLKSGSIDSASGLVAARNVAFNSATLGDFRADWKAARTRNEWRLDLSHLALGSMQAQATLGHARLTIDSITRRVHGSIDAISAQSALVLLRLAGSANGTLSQVVFDWDGAAADERRLTASARWSPTMAAENAGDFALKAQLRWTRASSGWTVTADRLSADQGPAHFQLEGTLLPLDLTAHVQHADIAAIRSLAPERWSEWLGSQAVALESGLVLQADVHFTDAVKEGSAQLSSARIVATDRMPGIEAADGLVEWRGQQWSAKLAGGRVGDVEIRTLNARWNSGTNSLQSLRLRATGQLEEMTSWIDAHTQFAASLKVPTTLPWTGPARIDFDLHGAAGGAPHLQLALESARVALAPQFPAVESLYGALVIDDGRVKRSTLNGTWLGGPVALHLASRAGKLIAQFDGRFDAAVLGQTLGLDSAFLRGRSAWRGEWQWEPATNSTPVLWRGEAESDLLDVGSTLPAPFDKRAGESLALRLDAEGLGAGGAVTLSAADRVQAKLAVVADAGGRWRVERGGISIGTREPELPDNPSLAVDGSVTTLDLTTILDGWRDFIASSDAPPLSARVKVDTLRIAGRSFPAVELDADQTSGGLQAVFDSRDLAGRLSIGLSGEAAVPAQLHLTRLNLAETAPTPQPSAFFTLAGLLAQGAQVTIDQLLRDDHLLGRLTSTIETRQDSIAFNSLELTGQLYGAHGAIECGMDLAACHGDISLETSDVAATLAAFGFKDDVSAGRGTLEATLAWNTRDAAASVNGRARLALASGSVRPGTSAGSPFALFVVPTLLGSTTSEILPFERLEGQFDLRDGNAYTSDLHLDGDLEVIVKGRTGLAARDYDQTAWILRGEDRLPAAIRRVGAAPAVASVWLGVRDFLTVNTSRKLVHVGGPWASPVVTTHANEGQP